jgi:hypothetical protein
MVLRLFAVRQADNQAVIGFFWAESIGSLCLMVDSVANPDDCEYKPIDRERVSWLSRMIAPAGTATVR